MSIATERGDGGETSLPGGSRISKADLRVEAYGTIDELISSMGLARALCRNAQIRDLTESIQRELFKVGSAIDTSPESRTEQPDIGDEMVDGLTKEVHRIEAIEGLLADWSLPGADAASAAYDVARTVCRRAERLAVRVSAEISPIQPNVLRYLNRLSDLLWLFGRQIEVEQNINSALRKTGDKGPRWSQAWLVVIAILSLAMPGMVRADSLSGRVLDPQGNVVADANIRLFDRCRPSAHSRRGRPCRAQCGDVRRRASSPRRPHACSELHTGPTRRESGSFARPLLRVTGRAVCEAYLARPV